MTRISRRSLLSTCGTGIVALSAGCTGVLSSGNQLQSKLDGVESATEKYADPKKALEDGFKLGGPYVPGMGWHFTNPKRLEDAAKNGLDVEKPPMLTYLDNHDTDGLKLASVEYALPSKVAEEKGTPDLFDDEDADVTEKWHTHEAATHVFANGNGEQDNPKKLSFESLTGKENWAEFRPVDEDLEAGDTISLNWGKPNAKEGENKEERVVDLVANHPSLTTLHAWVHVENPAGAFKPVNTKYTEDGHSH